MTTRDFDFLMGRWSVKNRRLKQRRTAALDWDEFESESDTRPLFGGAGNVEEIVFATKGFSGVTLRLFRPETNDWALYWVNSRDGQLQPPVVGRFVDGLGEFFGDDVDDGVPIRVRYRWSGCTPTSARWEQAFSYDQGHTWETNWSMHFTRVNPRR